MRAALLAAKGPEHERAVGRAREDRDAVGAHVDARDDAAVLVRAHRRHVAALGALQQRGAAQRAVGVPAGEQPAALGGDGVARRDAGRARGGAAGGERGVRRGGGLEAEGAAAAVGLERVPAAAGV